MRTSSMSSWTQHCTPLDLHYVSTSMHGLPLRSSIRLSLRYNGGRFGAVPQQLIAGWDTRARRGAAVDWRAGYGARAAISPSLDSRYLLQQKNWSSAAWSCASSVPCHVFLKTDQKILSNFKIPENRWTKNSSLWYTAKCKSNTA